MTSDEQKRALFLPEADNYVVLPLREQLDYYAQIVQTEFRKSVDELKNQAEALEKDDVLLYGRPHAAR